MPNIFPFVFFGFWFLKRESAHKAVTQKPVATHQLRNAKGLGSSWASAEDEKLCKKCKAQRRWHFHKQRERRESYVLGPDPDCFYYADHVGEESLRRTAAEGSWILAARTRLFTSEQSGQRDPYKIQSAAGHKLSAAGLPRRLHTHPGVMMP